MTKLKELREDNDKTQKEIANILNTTQQQYSLYENGYRELKQTQIKKICEYYNISADYIIGLPEMPYPKRKP